MTWLGFSCLELAKIFIQTLAIVIGWVVVHQLTVTRELNKSRREVIFDSADTLIEKVSELFVLALKYHTENRSKSDEVTLKMSLKDVSGQIDLLGDLSVSSVHLDECRKGLIALRKAITASHFEDEHTAPLAQSSSQIQLIAAEVLALNHSFFKLKNSQFPKN
jgi:hypothetical protein